MTGGLKSVPDQGDDERLSWKHWLEDRVAAALISFSRLLPYRQRIALMGWLGAYVIGPVAGLNARVRANLALIFPGMPSREVRRLSRAVPGNLGRALAETFAGEEFFAHARKSTIGGTGLAALDAARDARRPVILVTAHLGNYNAGRVVLRDRKYPVAALYMPMHNPAFNKRYVAAMAKIAAPVLPRNRAGLAAMVKHLRNGGMIGLVADHYMSHGPLVDFLGQPARTSTAPAELALKHNALLVPLYGIRADDKLHFRIIVEEPIPHTDPLTMTRALNASLGAMVRAHMDQWMWTHRRWKNNACGGLD